MKDHIKEKLAVSTTFDEVKAIIDDYMDYYNNRRYQWHLAKLAPNEYYQFVTVGGYPLDVASVPPLPKIAKESAMLRGRGLAESKICHFIQRPKSKLRFV